MRKLILLISFLSIPLFSQELPPPVPSRYITDDYGPRNLEGDYDWHAGIDYRADTGTTVTTVEGGDIEYIRSYSTPGGGGWRIRIHGAHAYWTYMHLFSDNSNPRSGGWEAINATLEDTSEKTRPDPNRVGI